MNVKILAKVLQFVFIGFTLFFLGIWISGIEIPIEPEPLIVLLGLASGAVATLSKKYENVLKAEKYSVANVLAQGYVKNFLEPVVTQLKKDNPDERVRFYIFVPDLLSELTSKAIDRWKSDLIEKGFRSKMMKVKLPEGRGLRDVMTVANSDSRSIYFDFPNTLFSLTDYVEYKVNSPGNSLNQAEKNRLGREYIKRFREQLIQDLKELRLYPDVVKLTDNNLKIEF
ncbi:MAG: STING domain-containing protein [Mangrovibacterium sp.]